MTVGTDLVLFVQPEIIAPSFNDNTISFNLGIPSFGQASITIEKSSGSSHDHTQRKPTADEPCPLLCIQMECAKEFLGQIQFGRVDRRFYSPNQ